MDERVAKLKTPEECRSFMGNALNLGRDDLAREALLHAVALRIKAHPAKSAVEAECIEAVCAYEEAQAAKPGRRASAQPTWTTIKKVGALQAIDKVVSQPDDTARLEALRAVGLEHLTYEHVIARHTGEFSFEAVELSRKRIAKWKKEKA
jgi:hypothetical protein